MAVKRTTFESTREAVYHYKIYNYTTGLLTPDSCPCRVLGETGKRYLIQLWGAAWRHSIGDKLWVHKKSVQVKELTLPLEF